MSNTQGHILYFKDANDVWHSIPVSVLDVYDSYYEYCTSNGIEPVTRETYYQTLGQLQRLVDEFATNSANINALMNSLREGALPVNMGGLGIQFDDEAAMIDYLRSKLANIEGPGDGSALATQQEVSDLQQAVDDLDTVTFKAADINSGTRSPNSTTTGKYYFQYNG